MIYFLVLKVLIWEVARMKYFLRKSKLKRGEYLQIYKSEYIRGVGSRNTSYKAVGYVCDLKEKGVKDPVAKAQAEVKRLNDALREQEAGERARKIGTLSPERHLGYFALKGVANSLTFFEKAIRAISSVRSFQYDVYDMMMALVYARATYPSSKKRTHEDILPQLFEDVGGDSYHQVLSCCEFLGQDYKKIANMLTRSVQKTYGLDFSHTYFDCTNFYFEIDVEDEFRKKGPSKENRHDPIVGLGLLLDANQIPVAMSIFPGNESEKPKLRQALAELRRESGMDGRTIQIADKGLNCARNIHEAILNGDGYIFSKSIKMQGDAELNWFLSLDSSTWDKVYESKEDGAREEKYRYCSFVDKFQYDYNDDLGCRVSFEAKERRVITYSPKLAMKKILELNRQVEKASNLCLYKAKKEEFGDCAKYVSFRTDNGSKAVPVLNEKAIALERRLAGYNMLVTSEIGFKPRTIYNTYHNLWRIEQSFRMMKSYLEARPVYFSREDSIKGHFLICYICIVLERILEFHVLGSRFSHEKIMAFIKDFRLVRLDTKDYINMLTSKNEVGQFLSSTLFPKISNYILSPTDVSSLLKARLRKRIEEV